MAGILEKVRPFGYTPLASRIKGEVLKYNFRGISRLVVDKSGHGNNGKLMPKEDPPRRKIVSWFPFRVVLVLDGENDYVKSSDGPEYRHISDISISASVVPETGMDRFGRIVEKRDAFECWLDSRGAIGFRLRDDGWNWFIRAGTTVDLEPGKSHDVKFEWDDDTGDAQVLLDEEVVARGTGHGRITERSSPVNIGGTSSLFKGKIERVTISTGSGSR